MKLTASSLLLLLFADMLIAANPVRNYDIYDSLSVELAKDLYQREIKDKILLVNYTINTVPAGKIFEKALLDLLITNDIDVRSDSTAQVSHNIEILRFDTNFEYYDNSNDSLVRTINFEGFVKSFVHESSSYNKYSKQYRDTVAFVDISLLQNPQIPIVNGTVPDRKRSFYEKALEPIILVSAAVLSVFIFFSVRSK
ncbi:MAG: hypothetical protein WCZ17_10230 [Candidatus Kapaibacterium sp.]|jgi:hypothetical protein